MLAATADPAVATFLRKVATLGGRLGRKRDRMIPTLSIRGMLLLLGQFVALDT